MIQIENLEFIIGISIKMEKKTCKSNSHTIQTLFLKSQRFSSERSTDFYDDYVEKCRSNSIQTQSPILSKSVEKCRSNNSNQIQ